MNNEVTEAMERQKKIANLNFGLTSTTLGLTQILESYKPTPRSNGDRPIRWLDMAWEDAADLIMMAQIAAKYSIEETDLLLSELDDLEDDLANARQTLKQYSGDLEEAREELRKARKREAAWAGVYQELWERCIDRMSEEEKARHNEHKRRLLDSAK